MIYAQLMRTGEVSFNLSVLTDSARAVAWRESDVEQLG